MNGSYTPRTLPVGGESPRSLAEALLASSTYKVVGNMTFVTVAAVSAGIELGKLSAVMFIIET